MAAALQALTAPCQPLGPAPCPFAQSPRGRGILLGQLSRAYPDDPIATFDLKFLVLQIQEH